MTTLTDQILAVQRMARCSRYWARAARATAAEFRPEFDALMSEGLTAPLDELRTRLRQEQIVDLRSVTLDRDAEARRHDREAEELEAVVRRLEEMNTVLSSFRIAPPDAEGDVWLHIITPSDDETEMGRHGAFNLGKPVNPEQPESSPARIKVAHHVARLLEDARQRALGDHK